MIYSFRLQKYEEISERPNDFGKKDICNYVEISKVMIHETDGHTKNAEVLW